MPFSARAQSAPIHIVALGDSLTAGYRLQPHQAFPAVLESRLREMGYHVTITNAGISGDTTAGGLARLGSVLAKNPDMVIVELGANDAFRITPPQQTFNNLNTIIQRLKAENITVVFAGMKAPISFGQTSYADVFNSVFEKLANKHKDVFYYPFFLEGIALAADLNLPDGIHPNATGVEVIVENILPTVEEALESMGAETASNSIF